METTSKVKDFEGRSVAGATELLLCANADPATQQRRPSANAGVPRLRRFAAALGMTAFMAQQMRGFFACGSE